MLTSNRKSLEIKKLLLTNRIEQSFFFQLHQERERLDAMMTHLRMDGKDSRNGSDPIDSGLKSTPNKSASAVSQGNLKTSTLVILAGFVNAKKNEFGSGISVFWKISENRRKTRHITFDLFILFYCIFTCQVYICSK